MKFSSVVLCSILAQLASAAPVYVTDFVTQMVTITVKPHEGASSTGVAIPSETTSSAHLSKATSSAAVYQEPAPSSSSASVSVDIYQEPASSSSVASSEGAATTTISAETTSSTAATTSSTAAAATSSSSSSSSLSSFQQTMLDTHNAKRALHQASDLTWDSTLESYAQDYADKYDCSGTLTHSGGPYGENLAVGYSAEGAVEAWYDEGNDYDYSSCSTYDHFTQVVWKSTTKVGCGLKECGGSVGDYIICSYDPAGNYVGECSENVLP